MVCKHGSHVTSTPKATAADSGRFLVGGWYTRSHEIFSIRQVRGRGVKT